MSFIDGISGAFGFRPTTTGGPGEPANPAAQEAPPAGDTAGQATLSDRLRSTFNTSFSSSMATVFERGVAGAYDDPTLALAEQAALQRLRAAREAAHITPAAPGGDPVAGGGPVGADAAPSAEPATTPAPDAASIGLTERRELYAVRVAQSEARLANISTSLRVDFPAGAELASASTGWDPEAFVPRTREEAEAFAQRMVIDATEGAARLEILKTQLDAVTLEAQASGDPEAAARVTELEEAFARQQSYVDKLARIVDTASTGSLSEAGSDAMRTGGLAGAQDLSTRELAAALRSAGMSEAQVARTVGAREMGLEQEQNGGSPRLERIATASADWTWANRANLQAARRSEERRIEDQRRQEADQRVDDRRAEKRSERRRLDARAGQQRQEARATQQHQAVAASSERRATFHQFLAAIEADTAARRAEAS